MEGKEAGAAAAAATAAGAAAAADAATQKTDAPRRSERSLKRTLKVIQEELSVIKDNYDSMCHDGFNGLTAIELKSVLKEMKTMCITYRKGAKELIDHLLAIKSISEANEVHNEQKEFIGNVRETVRLWNAQLVALGDDAISSLGSLNTTISSRGSESPMLNKYLNELSVHQEEHENDDADQEGMEVRNQSQVGLNSTTGSVVKNSVRVEGAQTNSPTQAINGTSSTPSDSTGDTPGTAKNPPGTGDGQRTSVSFDVKTEGNTRITKRNDNVMASASANPFTEVCVVISPTAGDITDHIVRTELYRNKNGLVPFDGSPHLLAGWVDRIRGKIRGLSLQPADILHLLEFHCTGEAKTYLNEISATTGHIDVEILNEIWTEFKQRFASNNRIVQYFRDKVDNLPRIKGNDWATQLSTYHHVCKLILFNKEHCEGLKIYDLAQGMEQLRNKLPLTIKDRWRTEAHAYATLHGKFHPPFEVFVKFLKVMAAEYSTSDDMYGEKPKESKLYKVHKTTEVIDEDGEATNTCSFHEGEPHSIHECNEFADLSYEERKLFATENDLCYSCLGSHTAADCPRKMKCNECGRRHATLMHNPSFVRTRSD